MKLTERAAARIRAIMAEKGAGAAGLRIGVKKGGCAGMEYTMEWAAEQKPFDEVVEHDGARVLIDPKAVMYLLGTEMDYKTDKLVVPVRVHQPQPDGLVRLRRVGEPGTRAGDKLEALQLRLRADCRVDCVARSIARRHVRRPPNVTTLAALRRS